MKAFHKVAGYIPFYRTNGDDYVYTIVNLGKQHGVYPWRVEVAELSWVSDLAVAGRKIYELGFDTKRECVAFCMAFDAHDSISVDSKRKAGRNAALEVM